jgi:hypothetical protein
MLTKVIHTAAFIVLLAIPAVNSNPPPGLRFATVATGEQQGHEGVKTNTNATLVTEFDRGFTYAAYSLEVFHGVRVTQAHYHCAAAGLDGPIVAFLYGFNPKGVNITGRLKASAIRNADIRNATDFATTPGCGVTINNIASLYAAIKQGLIYVNVHTVANPNGEVRGQIYDFTS